eukprot:2126680-Amphidinium_carterae.1
MAAVKQTRLAIHFAADELLLDSTFAPEAKQGFHILHISMLSGRSTVVVSGSRSPERPTLPKQLKDRSKNRSI